MADFNTIRRFKKAHGMKRLFERFGLALDEVEYDKILKDIDDYTNKPIHVIAKDGKSFHVISVQGNELIILFDWEYTVILTAYRRSWFTELPNGDWKRTPKKLKSKVMRKINKDSTLGGRFARVPII